MFEQLVKVLSANQVSMSTDAELRPASYLLNPSMGIVGGRLSGELLLLRQQSLLCLHEVAKFSKGMAVKQGDAKEYLRRFGEPLPGYYKNRVVALVKAGFMETWPVGRIHMNRVTDLGMVIGSYYPLVFPDKVGPNGYNFLADVLQSIDIFGKLPPLKKSVINDGIKAHYTQGDIQPKLNAKGKRVLNALRHIDEVTRKACPLIGYPPVSTRGKNMVVGNFLKDLVPQEEMSGALH